MLPIVIRSTEEMLQAGARRAARGSYALGTRKSRTILTVVLPAAFRGVVSGALLAVARAAGETAPLLFTIGVASSLNLSLFDGPNTALSAQIFRNAKSPFAGAMTGRGVPRSRSSSSCSSSPIAAASCPHGRSSSRGLTRRRP